MSVPSKQYLDDLIALNGAPKVTYPYGGYTFPRIERVITVPKGRVSAQPTTLDDFPGAVLVQVNELKRDQTDVRAYFRYDTLPGPWNTDTSADPETSIPVLVARRKRSASDQFTTGEITPPTVNVQSIATGAVPIVTVDADPGLPPGAFVAFTGTNSTPALGNVQIVDILSPTQFTVRPPSAVTIAGTVAGTAAGISLIIRERKPTENQLVYVEVDSMVALPDISTANQDVECSKDDSLPDVLRRIIGISDESTTNETTEYSLQMSGSILVDVQPGYRGPMQGRRKTFFFNGPPPDSFFAQYAPSRFLLSSGNAVVRGFTQRLTQTGITTSYNYRGVSLPSAITGARGTVDSTEGTGTAQFTVGLSASSPTFWRLGDTLRRLEEPQKWRVGAWRVVLYELIMPYSSGAPLADFFYQTITASYPHGSAIATNSPVGLSGASGFSVSPALPTGLSINSATGAITGTPGSTHVEALYFITATDVNGKPIASYVYITVT